MVTETATAPPARSPTRNFPRNFWGSLSLTPSAAKNIALTSLFLNLLATALPVFTRVVYDKIVPNFAEATLWILLSGMVLVLLADSLFKASRSYVTNAIAADANAELEHNFMGHLLRLPHGTNMAKTSFYLHVLQEVSQFHCQKLLPTLIDMPFVVGFLLIIYLISPPMVIVTVVIGVLLVAIQLAFHHKLNRALMVSQAATEQRLQSVSELLNGRDTIRQLARYLPFMQEWQHTSTNAAHGMARAQFVQQLVFGVCQTLMILNTVLLMVVGVYQINAGALSIGGMLAISLLSARALAPLFGIGEVAAKWPKLKQERAAVDALLALPAEDAGEPISLQGELRLENANVTLSNRPILKNCTVALQSGEKLALIGSSGAGKSTLLKVLSQELPLTDGTLFWDDYANMPSAALRTNMGIVEQHPYFFANTLRENLCLGTTYTDEELYKVLDVVGLTPFIKATGHGLDLPLQAGGINLSGGQRQCLALARALVRQPNIMLLDEPTAMMDHAMEQQLVQNLRFALKDKTVVLISHRTPLLALVDYIAVLENGEITRQGPRQQVLQALVKQPPDVANKVSNEVAANG